MNKIESTLLDIGIPPNQCGFGYIVDALERITEDKSYMYNTCALYARVAQDTGSTASRVERGIRHSIESAFNRIDPDTLTRYFGNYIDRLRGKPTSSEFLATVMLHLKGAKT